ncbi:MAG: flavin-containing monooxygenase [Janthinobacterium lividum]
MPHVAVIGAGAAGLSAAKHLIDAGCDVTVFELGSQIGGLWVYENDNGLSPAYASLHLNSENRVTAYKDFPFPEEAPLYPDHQAVAQYLQAYADRFDLRRLIRFGARVMSVRPGWTVTLADDTTERFDAVVVASGHQGVPKHPPFAAEFTGEYLHAHAYRTPERFRDKDVLVIGVGNSACDIAADICTVTASTTMVARSPVLFMPRMVLGVPTSRVLARIEKPWMPWPLRRRIREWIARVAHGRMEQWGFTTPTTRTHPAGHHLLMAQFIWGRVRARPGIAAVSGQDVRFVDGTSARYDTIIAATGYDVDLPFLSPELSPVRGHWLDLYRRVVRPGVPGLFFVGFFNVTGGGNIRMMDDQAEWVAALVTGRAGLPDEAAMSADIRQEQARIQALYPDSPRYGLELDPREYRASLAQERRRSARATAAN